MTSKIFIAAFAIIATFIIGFLQGAQWSLKEIKRDKARIAKREASDRLKDKKKVEEEDG